MNFSHSLHFAVPSFDLMFKAVHLPRCEKEKIYNFPGRLFDGDIVVFFNLLWRFLRND